MITKTDRENSVSSSRAKRDLLYFSYRYRLGSYKARKAGIEPTLMFAKREGSGAIRLYDLGADFNGLNSNLLHQPTPNQEKFAIIRFRQWRQQERVLKRLAKRRIPNKSV